ncbi:MAG: hypothetical protein MZV64_23730 [Ignavibacteriales bacterium]|nr:hypothetical protein [Ignavibacteriales bacterium]
MRPRLLLGDARLLGERRHDLRLGHRLCCHRVQFLLRDRTACCTARPISIQMRGPL